MDSIVSCVDGHCLCGYANPRKYKINHPNNVVAVPKSTISKTLFVGVSDLEIGIGGFGKWLR